jgi:hypothetical protein
MLTLRQHTSACVSIRQHVSACVCMRLHASAYVSIPGQEIVRLPAEWLWGVDALQLLTRQYVHFCTSKAAAPQASVSVLLYE